METVEARVTNINSQGQNLKDREVEELSDEESRRNMTNALSIAMKFSEVGLESVFILAYSSGEIKDVASFAIPYIILTMCIATLFIIIYTFYHKSRTAILTLDLFICSIFSCVYMMFDYLNSSTTPLYLGYIVGLTYFSEVTFLLFLLIFPTNKKRNCNPFSMGNCSGLLSVSENN